MAAKINALYTIKAWKMKDGERVGNALNLYFVSLKQMEETATILRREGYGLEKDSWGTSIFRSVEEAVQRAHNFLG